MKNRVMNNFHQKAILVILFCIGFLAAIGQPPAPVQNQVKKLMPNPVPQSPNVAALGKYGDYEVNHFNGVPEISIPIFEVKSGGLSVPITLSYHASGVKPTDVAGWVGLGWSLSAGGEVSRNVQGKPDEQHYYGNALKQSVAVCGPAGVGTYYYLQYAATSVIDTEPDIFNYSFPGSGGKFILPNAAQPLLFPYAPIVISTSSGFGKFEITNEQGVLHRFGQNALGTKFAQDGTNATNGGNPSINAVTAWHLMDMVAPNSNDQITFEYQPLGSSPTHDVSYSYTVLDQCFLANIGPEGPFCPNQFYLQPTNNDSNITQVGLQTITFETGKVVFEISTTNRSDIPSLKRLERIKIYSTVNGQDILQKTIKFNYSYFTNAVAGNQALKLDGVQFLDKVDVPVQNYTFTYFTNSFSWTPNAVNFLNARDMWGYYNGALSNTDLILPQTIPFNTTPGTATVNHTFGGALNRNVNPLYIKEGVLKRINFPTGGYSEFDFESNRYSKSGVPTDVGGLRVTKITSSDGSAAPPIVKTYKYGSGESGLGIANFMDNELNYNSTMMVYSDCEGIMPVVNYQSRSFFSKSLGGESAIMYPYVTEYIGDPAGTFNGKTVFIYDNGSPSFDAPNTMPGSTKIYKNSLAWKRGKLTSKTVYDNANRIISSTSINRSLLKDASNFIGWSVYQFIGGNNSPICSGNGCFNEVGEYINAQTYMYGTIYQSSGVLVETSVTESTYENGDLNKAIIKAETKTVHPDKLQVILSNTSLSTTNEQMVTVNTYPFQLTPNINSSNAAKGVYMLNSKNIVASPIETYTYLQNSDGSNQRITSGQVTSYKQNPSNTNQVVPDQIYLWESAATVPKASYVPVAVNPTNDGLTMDIRHKLRVSIPNYDTYGNVQLVSKVNDVPISYKYGYNFSLPVAEVTNAQNTNAITEFLYESFEENNAVGVTSNPLLSHSASKYFVGDYTVTFTMPNARTYVIEYWYLDGSNKWQYISKPYVGTSMVLAEGSAIDDIRIYPKDAQMKSYTHDPVLGIRSIIDESSRTTVYEYDSFGRLKLIKNDKGEIEKQYLYNYKGN
jgi:hypothetical protein